MTAARLPVMRILDSTTSVKGMWYQKNNPYTVFMDQRKETVRIPYGKGKADLWRIAPDIVCKWEHLPFKDSSFDMVVFDPPHIIRRKGIIEGPITKKYGLFYKDSWRSVMIAGSHELFRVLKDNGFFILKWDECNIKIEEILRLIPYKPMFGTRTGQKNKCHWICFVKSNNHTPELSQWCGVSQ